ncbi:phage tail fiber protein [Shinella zoogloeoides]|uniref:phage tail fiber domain-containing protein n=1 Tax=Shinella zoogloeoides TaxID=352475 RepID=UPI0028AB3613|nr:phage tail fiber protein [Shinella zoogloeoides]
MPLSYAHSTGDGVNRNFDVPCEYLSKAHISVKVDGVPVTFSWLDTYRLKTTTAPPMGSVVEVRRTTPRQERLVTFTDGSTLVQSDLNTSTLQSFFLSQEAFDQGAASMAVTEDGQFSALNRRLANLADPVNSQDAVTKAWALNMTNTNVGAAVVAKDAAVVAKNASETARAGAETARTTAEGYLNSAVAARDAAQGYRDTANTHRVDAQAAKVAAEAARTGAEAARDTASTKATSAASSATAAAQSAVEAAKFDPANFYTKPQTYSRTEVDGRLSDARAQTLADLEKRGVPLGMIVHSAVPLETQGYLRCNGQPCTPVWPDLRAALIAAGSPFGNNGVDPLLPDEETANRFRRAAGGGLAVGTVQGDAIRNITGSLYFGGSISPLRASDGVVTGAFKRGTARTNATTGGTTSANDIEFDASLVVPTADENRPKSIAYLPYIKAFGAITIEGMADLSALFNALATKAEAEAGADNTKLMTALRVKEAITAQVVPATGVGQTWQVASRIVGTIYQNTTGRAIAVSYYGTSACMLQVSTDNATWVDLASTAFTATNAIIPPAHYYRFNGGTLSFVRELR